jgi:hypothetical protein
MPVRSVMKHFSDELLVSPATKVRAAGVRS